jgi:mRNA interferase MazF
VIVSPDELNQHLRTVLIAPLTTGGRPYPWRVECRIQDQQGRVALDQLRTVDREHLVQYVEPLPDETLTAVLAVLAEFFAT